MKYRHKKAFGLLYSSVRPFTIALKFFPDVVYHAGSILNIKTVISLIFLPVFLVYSSVEYYYCNLFCSEFHALCARWYQSIFTHILPCKARRSGIVVIILVLIIALY